MKIISEGLIVWRRQIISSENGGAGDEKMEGSFWDVSFDS